MFSVSSVSKSYGKNKVLTDVSLSVSPGECIALLGINGSGKSTLLGILSRNIKPDSGCFGFDCQANAALLPQDNPLIPELTAIDNIRLWHPGSRKTVMNSHNMSICQSRCGFISGQTCLKALRWNEEEAKPCHHDDV